MYPELEQPVPPGEAVVKGELVLRTVEPSHVVSCYPDTTGPREAN